MKYLPPVVKSRLRMPTQTILAQDGIGKPNPCNRVRKKISPV